MSPLKRGALIVLEGGDCTGKTTQAKMIIERLTSSGVKAERMSFPDRSTPVGSMISDYLKGTSELEDHCIHLLYSANRWELVPKMRRLLKEGTTLIVDRYAFSGVAFSAAKQREDMNIVWCKQPDVGLPRPDAVLYLKADSDDITRRGGFGQERYEKREFQERVKEVYELLKDDDWIEVNASGSIEEVNENLMKIIGCVMQQVHSKPILGLWASFTG